jgi:hypothetical protein
MKYISEKCLIKFYDQQEGEMDKRLIFSYLFILWNFHCEFTDSLV